MANFQQIRCPIIKLSAGKEPTVIRYQQMLIAYMISKAFTNEVARKGSISVSHSQCVKTAMRSAAVEPRKRSHQKALFFLVCSIRNYFTVFL
jgi:hypothetical protein